MTVRPEWFPMRKYILFLLTLTLLAGCGKKGPLIYPEMLAPAAPAPVSVRQTGKNVSLVFGLPQKDQAGRGISNIAGVKVTRMVSVAGSGVVCTACTADFLLFSTVYLDAIAPGSGTVRSGNLLQIIDGDARSGNQYAYVATASTKEGVDGRGALPVGIELLQPPVPPQLKVAAEPTEIQIDFGLALPVKGASFAGYKLYRWAKGEPVPFVQLGSQLIVGQRYIDTTLDRSLVYNYAARQVVRMPNGVEIESDLSEVVSSQLVKE